MNDLLNNLTTEQATQILELAKIIEGQNRTSNSNEPEWYSLFDKTTYKNGNEKIDPTINNFIIYLTHHEKYRGQFKYNDFTNTREIFGRSMRDDDVDDICRDIDKDLHLYSRERVKNAISCVFNDNHYDPIKDYFNSLNWDGKSRCETLFIDTLGADDNRLNREMTYKWLLATVKRQLQPGCKFDSMIILQGEQGIGKTTVTQKLCRKPLHQDSMSLEEIQDKDIEIKMSRTSIMVIDELDAFDKKDIRQVKTFMTLSGSKEIRGAYKEYHQPYSRHCTLIGSTNEATFLHDSTSEIERRFWVIKCNNTKRTFDNLMTDDYIDQIWAEAYTKLNEDFEQQLWLSDEVADDFKEMQEEFKSYKSDPVVDYIEEILNRRYDLIDGTFKSLADFEHQYFNTDYNTNIAATDYINYIPWTWLCYILKKKFGEKRTAKYFTIACKDWEYNTTPIRRRNIWDKQYRCLFRKEPKENNNSVKEFFEK